MQVGRFFSLGLGRVGQLLSSRVLVVRSPFRSATQRAAHELCCFGFDNLRQAQKFGQSLAGQGLSFQIRQSQWLTTYPFEVILRGDTDLARTLAYWDRRDYRQLQVAPLPARKLQPIDPIAA